MPENKKPDRIYSAGKVKLNVWVNEGQDYTTVAYAPVKNYKVGKGDDAKWKTSTSFSLVDLADLELCIQKARLAERVKSPGGNTSGDTKKDDSPAF